MRIIKTSGYKTVQPINEDEYPSIPGMEGPYRYKNGRILYYDPREGKYYDRKTDMYVETEEATFDPIADREKNISNNDDRSPHGRLYSL